MAHRERRTGRAVPPGRPARIVIDPFPLALFEDVYFTRVKRKVYERDTRGRFKSRGGNSHSVVIEEEAQ